MKQFQPHDTNPMSWNEFGDIAAKLVTTIQQYFESEHTAIDAIAPILRNGAIPGTIIANKLQIITQMPIQLKYNYKESRPIQLLPFYKPLTKDLGTKPNILITECNTFSGKSAEAAAAIVLQQYPSANLYYASIAKVYREFEVILPMYKKYFYGVLTNENFEANDDLQKSLNIRPKITIFPWETTTLELDDINAALSRPTE